MNNFKKVGIGDRNAAINIREDARKMLTAETVRIRTIEKQENMPVSGQKNRGARMSATLEDDRSCK